MHNFRCYDKKAMSFRPGINLLIGDNATGKTSLIRACNLVANAFFSGYSDENTVWKSATDDDFRTVGEEEGLTRLPEQPVSVSFHLGVNDLPPFQLSTGEQVSIDENTSLNLLKRSKKNKAGLLKGLQPLRHYGASLMHSSHFKNAAGTIEQRCALPVYACFTTEDIHSRDRRAFASVAPTAGTEGTSADFSQGPIYCDDTCSDGD